ncbi:hypothetical protein U0070_002894, partial [Myodes glareolus]
MKKTKRLIPHQSDGYVKMKMQTSDFWELPVPCVKELKTLLLYSRSHRAEFAHVSSKNYKANRELS